MIKYDVVVHGKWVEEEDEGYYCCSKCGQAVDKECVPWFKFCPNCGADMRGSFQNGNNHAKDWPPYMDLPRGRKDGDGNG